MSLWWTLVGAGVLISLTPGAGAVNTMANSLAAGWRRSPLWIQYLIFTVTVVVIDIVVMWLFFALAAKGLRRFMRDAAGQRVLNRIFGSLFVAVGIMLAVLE